MLYGTSDDKPATTDEDIVKEANERWHAIKDWQGTEDERARDDIKFANGDARNAWQWPEKIYAARTGEESNLPCLTINKTRSHNDIIINAMSKNGTGIKVRPTAGGASYESAKVMQSVIRRIQYISRFSTQKRKVAEAQVDGGIGYILIETNYISSRSRNQDIYLRAAPDSTGVYLDRWIKEPDGSDADHGFIFDELPRKEFNLKYPKAKDEVGTAPLNTQLAAWLTDKSVTVVKYFRKKKTPDTYVWYKQSDDSPEVEKLASEIKDEAGRKIYKALMEDIKEGYIEGGTRPVTNDEVEWFLIAGDKIIDRGKWAGKYIPICRCVGKELVVDKTLDRKGHTRPLIDANRMLNYGNSAAVESVASHVKSKWLAPARAIEGQEGWKTANINNFAVLLYNDVDDEAPEGAQQIPPPTPVEPAQISPGWLKVAEDAERQMMMISGQWQAQLGENDTQSAASGKAINERQEQGDTATYHFPEHMGDMERYIGMQLLDLIPKIYDTKRTLHVLDDDGEKHWILIDPDQKEVVKELQDLKQDEEAVKIALNPAIGEYECVSDPGPDYATQRQEAWNALGTILQANKELVAVIGDLYFKYSDFPGAEAIMDRLQKEIKANKPYLFDDNLEPQMVALQEQSKRLIALNSELMSKLAEANLKIRGRDEKRDIEAYNAETSRIKATVEALSKILLTPQQRAQMEHEITAATHQHVFSVIEEANKANIANEANGSAE